MKTRPIILGLVILLGSLTSCSDDSSSQQAEDGGSNQAKEVVDPYTAEQHAEAKRLLEEFNYPEWTKFAKYVAEMDYIKNEDGQVIEEKLSKETVEGLEKVVKSLGQAPIPSELDAEKMKENIEDLLVRVEELKVLMEEDAGDLAVNSDFENIKTRSREIHQEISTTITAPAYQ